MKKLILALAVVLVGFVSCTKDNAEDKYPPVTACDTTNVTYSGVVAPIIAANCTTGGCHVNPTPSNIDLTTHAGVEHVASSGELLDAITHNGNASFMPQNAPKLDDCTIAKIRVWVNAGALNN